MTWYMLPGITGFLLGCIFMWLLALFADRNSKPDDVVRGSAKKETINHVRISCKSFSGNWCD